MFGAVVLGSIGYGFGAVIADNPLFTRNGTQLTINPPTTSLDVSTLTEGGGVTATSSAASAPILVASIDKENVIEVTPQGTGITLSLPATTTSGMSAIIPNAGDTRTIFVVNNSSTAGRGVTIAGGTGTLLDVASSTLSAGLKVVEPGGMARLDLVRKANTDIEVLMTPGQ